MATATIADSIPAAVTPHRSFHGSGRLASSRSTITIATSAGMAPDRVT